MFDVWDHCSENTLDIKPEEWREKMTCPWVHDILLKQWECGKEGSGWPLYREKNNSLFSLASIWLIQEVGTQYNGYCVTSA